MENEKKEITDHLKLTHRDLIDGEFYYTPDELAGTGGNTHNIIQYDKRVEVLIHFGHTPTFYKLDSTSESKDLLIKELVSALEIVVDFPKEDLDDYAIHGTNMYINSNQFQQILIALSKAKI